jgi:hypothetical protein
MRIINNGVGISGSVNLVRIRNSTVGTNRNGGILCGDSCHVEGTVVSSNGGIGISTRSGTVLGNAILSNGDLGLVSTIGPTGFGNNTIAGNNAGGSQVAGGVVSLHPNVCSPSAC